MSGDSDVGSSSVDGGRLSSRCEAVQPGREHRADGQIGVRGSVDGLHLDVRPGRRRRGGPRDEPERGLAVLDTPALHRARPVVRLEPQVAGDGRRRDRDQSRQRSQDAGHERLTARIHAGGPFAAREQVPLALPQAQVEVRAVAGVGLDPRRERRDPPVSARDRTHRLPKHHRRVSGGHRIARPDRQLELTVGVLGMELLQRQTLRLDRLDQVERERVVPDERDVAVAGTGVRGLERSVVAAGTDGELGLERRTDGQARCGERGTPSRWRTLAGTRRTARPPACTGRREPTPNRASRPAARWRPGRVAGAGRRSARR